ncbi:MAG TPA: sulfotransferase [Rhizomicrobium sp.]|nr:sulfotransferase [Rhizomicrobium sp.]
MIFLFGSARGGSTWLGKILDSHPETLYLHEPDIVDRGDDLLPFWFEGGVTPEQKANAGLYLSRLCGQRNLRAVGTRPIFRKAYHQSLQHHARMALIYLGKGIGRQIPSIEEKISIPDFSRLAASAPLVVKSVSALGRAEALIEGACGSMKPILLLRNPCAVVQSFLDGIRIGAMGHPPRITHLFATRSARSLGVTGQPDPDDLVDNLVWGWVLANAEAHAAVAKAGGIVLQYEALAADPIGVSKKLFADLDLEWSKATSDYIAEASQSRDGGYYSVSRDPNEAANRWRLKMDPEIFARVRDVACRSSIGRAYFSSDDRTALSSNSSIAD